MTLDGKHLRLDAQFVDYALVAIYFVFVMGIGFIARSRVSSSIDFFLSGRSLPAWVTGLAFISANLGAVEIMGMSANGAQYGMPTMHYFWIGAVPAMLFLGVVMMPFYYGSKVRSVPEFMRRRFGTGAHLVNALSFAVAQVLIAGINLYLLGTIVNVLLGWPLWVSVIVAAVDRADLHHPRRPVRGDLQRGSAVLRHRRRAAAADPRRPAQGRRLGRADRQGDRRPGGAEQLSSWPGNQLSGFESDFWSVVGIVFGLGFVLSFGYWTTNFVEVQRAMASESMSAAQRTPIIGSFPKMFMPFIVVIPGMISAVLVPEMIAYKADPEAHPNVTYNDSILYLMQDVLPNGLLGVAIAGLLAAFMAGMAANVSAFNTVFSYDLWQQYIIKHKPDEYYLRIGRLATVGATIIAIFTALHRVELHEPDGLPAAAVQLLQRAAVRHVHPRHVLEEDDAHRRLGGPGVRHAVGHHGVHPARERRCSPFPDRASSFVAAGVAFVVDIVVSVVVTQVTTPKPASRTRRPGLLRDPEGELPGSARRHLQVVAEAEPARADLADHGDRAQHHLLVRRTVAMSTPNVEVRKQSAGLFDIRNIIGLLVLIYGVVLTIMGLFVSERTTRENRRLERQPLGGYRDGAARGVLHRLGLPAPRRRDDHRGVRRADGGRLDTPTRQASCEGSCPWRCGASRR